MKPYQFLPLACGLAAAVPMLESRSASPYVAHMTRSWKPHGHSAGLSYPWGSHYYYIDAQVGTQSFQLVADLGSSYVWVPEAGFECLTVPCGIPSTYTSDSSFQNITNETFYASYGAGEVAGDTGFETISVAGLTIPQQQIGVATLIGQQFYEQGSGLFGLAFDGLAPFFKGRNLTTILQHLAKFQVPSSTVISNIFNVDKLTAPILSLALSRDASNTSYGGVLVIGGTPKLHLPTVNASAEFASVPIEFDPTLPGKQYGHYIFNYSSISYTNGSSCGTNNTQISVIADSGSPSLLLPPQIVEEISGLFSPPPDPKANFKISCDAIAPQISFNIGGRDFAIAPQDLIGKLIFNTTATAESSYTVSCYSIVQPGPPGEYILGEPFLKNVLAVFDWETHEIRYHAREHYES